MRWPAEIVVRPDSPEHKILIPRRVAEVLTVVLDGRRGQGLGKALLAAAEKVAHACGVTVLLAVIFAPNDDAAGFYTSAGFGPHGVLLTKELPGTSVRTPAPRLDDAGPRCTR
jgi:GNAT superfamily N-acetyltransferase